MTDEPNTKEGSPPSKTDGHTHGLRSAHRRVQRLPYELRDHIRVFLEERMYGEAIQLLTSLLASGGSSEATAPDAASPLWVPPPSHLAVLATLAVHPAYTSWAHDSGGGGGGGGGGAATNDARVAAHALQYLRHLLVVAGPGQAEMASAFQFRDAQGRAVGGGGGRAHAVKSGQGAARQSRNASAAGSRSQSVRPQRRRRQLFAQSAARSSLNNGGGRGGGGGGNGNGSNSDYVDSGSIAFDDNGEAMAEAVHAVAADRMAVDDKGADLNDPANDGWAADDDDAVGGRLATRDSVWVRGQDFWHVVAWALACSVGEPARWRCWHPWLTLVVDVLEADFGECLEAAHGGGNGQTGVADTDALYDSLLFQYLDSGGSSGGNSSSAHLRRIAQAILSDGSQPAALVREVFDKETVTVTVTARAGANTSSLAAQAAHARPLDLDNGKFGDYSDDDESAPPTPESLSRAASPTPGGKPQKPKNNSGLDQNAGFLESLELRRRLFYLVMLAAVYLPNDVAAPDAVYHSVCEVLRDGDIFVFSSFVAAPPPAMPAALASVSEAATAATAVPVPRPDQVFAGLLRHILITYLPSTVPKPHIVDRQTGTGASTTAGPVASVSVAVLERCFLPYAANTVLLGANVRMALAVESLFRLAWVANDKNNANDNDNNNDAYRLQWTPELEAAATVGVKAREARVSSKSKHATTTPTEVEVLGRDMLQRSGRRLLAMVQLVRMEGEERKMMDLM